MSPEISLALSWIVPLFLLLLGLFYVVLYDKYINRKKRKIMVLIVITAFFLILQNFFGYLLELNGNYPYLRTLEGIAGYSIRPLILILFCYIVDEEKDYLNLWFLAGINILVHLTAIFSGICFSIDEYNHFHRGPLGYTCHIISAVILIYLYYLTVKTYGMQDRRVIGIPLFSAILITLSVVLDTFVDYRTVPVAYLTIAVVIACIFFYIWLHLQFVRDHEEDMEAKQRISIMMSQIRPHFLFNTLSAIQALCEEDPKTASMVTERFGTYLRRNIDALNNEDMVEFKKELEHTRAYADIEKVRFPSIDIKYYIDESDFLVPALSLQPIVENAIKHGIRGKKEGGVVIVMTKKKDDDYEITVSDNGKGFSVDNIRSYGKDHIGIKNVMERIETMCNGKMYVESIEGKGTVIRMLIPCEEGKD